MQGGLLGCGFMAGHGAGCPMSASLGSSCFKGLEKFQPAERWQPQQAEHQLAGQQEEPRRRSRATLVAERASLQGRLVGRSPSRVAGSLM